MITVTWARIYLGSVGGGVGVSVAKGVPYVDESGGLVGKGVCIGLGGSRGDLAAGEA